MAAPFTAKRWSLAAAALVLAIGGAYLATRWLPNRFASLVEERLGRETGLRWRIGTLAIDLAGNLTLTDVSVRSEAGLEGGLSRVVVHPSFPVLLGRGGSVRAAVAGARLTLPVGRPAALSGTGGSRAARGGEAPGGLSSVRASLREVSAARDGRDGVLALSAGAADIALELTAAPTGSGPAFRLDLPEEALVIEVAAGPPGTARTLTATLAPSHGPRLAATAGVLLDGPRLRIDPIDGTIDQAPFKGRIVADLSGAKPRLDATVKLDALALSTRGNRARVDAADGITVPVPVERLPDLAWLAGFEGEAGVTIQRLALGPVRASAAAITVRLRDGRLDAGLDGATLYGGTARGRYVLGVASRPERHELSLTLAGIRTRALLLDVAGVSGLDGTGAVRIDLAGQGSTGRDILGSATGQAEVSVSDGRIDGIDLARAAGLPGLGGGLAARLDRLGARFAIGDGHATTDDLRLRTNLFDAKGTGVLDLINATIDLRLKPLAVVGGGRLNVPIRISGPWSAPAVDADFSGLARDPGGLMEGLTNLGAGLFGGEGGSTPRPEGRAPGRLRGGPRDDPERRNGLGDFLDGLMGRPDNPGSRP